MKIDEATVTYEVSLEALCRSIVVHKVHSIEVERLGAYLRQLVVSVTKIRELRHGYWRPTARQGNPTSLGRTIDL